MTVLEIRKSEDNGVFLKLSLWLYAVCSMVLEVFAAWGLQGWRWGYPGKLRIQTGT